MSRSTYGTSNRSPTSRLDKDCGLHPTILVPAVRLPTIRRLASLSPALAHGTTYQSMSRQHHLCSPSEND